MTPLTLLKRPSGFAPIAMSLLALSILILYVVTQGTAPQSDEGAAAHVWQILMAAQVPIVSFFALRWGPPAPRQAVLVLATQLVAASAAMAPVFLLHW